MEAHSHSETDTEPVVRFNQVTKTYDDGGVEVEAVRGVSFAVAPRRFTMIVGPSGSGKTTLLNLIGCIDRPTSGRLEVCGQDVGVLSDDEVTDFRALNVAFVFQSFNLFPVLTAYENVEYPLLLLGIPAANAVRVRWRCSTQSASPPWPSPPQPAQRRPTTARRDRARVDQAPGAGAGRRADGQPGYAHGRRDHRAHAAGAGPAGGQLRLFDPRPAADVSRRRDLRHPRRPPGAGLPMMTLKIAFRNILRNRRRSMMTLLAIAVGAIAIVLFGEFVRFVTAGLETNAVEGRPPDGLSHRLLRLRRRQPRRVRHR